MNDDLASIARALALEAGELVVTRRKGHIEVADTKSSSVDVVTAVDRESEALLHARLGELRPDDGFFGEEGRARPSLSGITWVVDPIDGTVNFLYDIPHYAISIAAVSGPAIPGQWQVEAAAILNPVSGELFHAARGEGAFLGDKRLQIGPPPQLSEALLATGFAYSAAVRAEQARLMSALLPEVRDIRRAGTASLDLAYVAAGRVDVFFERTLSPWDHAAGELIVTEAGGVIAGIASEAPGREGIFAGHADLVATLKSRISQLGGDILLAKVV